MARPHRKPVPPLAQEPGRAHPTLPAVGDGPAPTGESRWAEPNFRETWCEHGNQFAYFQAVRLLRQQGVPMTASPSLSLAFPSREVARIESDSSGSGVHVTVNFFGLYGAASPLPSFYTEDLFDDARDGDEAVRGFLNLLNHHLLALLFEGWVKYRFFIRLTESDAGSSSFCAVVRAMVGVVSRTADERGFGCAPLLAHRSRTALGLTTLVKYELDNVPVELLPCVARAVPIPQDQRMMLGVRSHALGEDSVLGRQTVDRSGGFRLKVGPLKRDRFRDLLHEGGERGRVEGLVSDYLSEPLVYDWELMLAGGEAEPARLGMLEWSRLGIDVILFTGFRSDPLSVFLKGVSR